MKNKVTQRIIIQYATDKKLIPKAALIKKWAGTALTLADQERASAELTVRIVDEKEMSTLNQKYRNKKGPTNVLSFPYTLPDEVDLDNDLLGDIVICAEVLKKEAKTQHKTKEAHWAHIVIHGVLHLLGYDHELQAEATKMETIEIKLLSQLGFANPYEAGENINHYD